MARADVPVRPGRARGRALGGVGLPAVAVAVLAPGRGRAVAVEAGAAGRAGADHRVHDLQRSQDVRVGGGQLAQPRQLQEAGVDHCALVERGAAVPDVVRDRRVRIAHLREPDEVAMRPERPVRRDCPGLHLPLPVVGDAEPHRGRRHVAVRTREIGRRNETGNLGRNCRRREAALLLPPLDAEGWPVRDDEVCRLPDVVAIERGVVVEAGLQRHQDRIGGLVELVAAGVGSGPAVDQRVARQLAGRELLALQQEAGGRPRGLQVAVGEQAREGLVEVP